VLSLPRSRDGATLEEAVRFASDDPTNVLDIRDAILCGDYLVGETFR